jgi:hypothetical protein
MTKDRAIFLVVTFLIILVWGTVRGFADTTGHDLFHHYYQYWRNQNGTHCCEEEHCRPTEARWNAELGQWEALVLGQWRLIMPHMMVKDDYGLDPFASVCHNDMGMIYCFDPPGPQT